MQTRVLFSTLFLAFFSLSAAAQEDVRVLHRKLKSDTEKSYKTKEITENEYNKMLDEHRTINKTIEIALLDGHLSPEEKNKILGKINRSKKRLVRYKHNSEVY